jgi:predicted DNA-binding transcriptional regulator AlpA
MTPTDEKAAPALDAPRAAGSITVGADDAKILALALSLRDAAALAGLSVGTFRRRSVTGQTPAAIRIGRVVRWRRADIVRWVELGFPCRDTFEGRAR